MKAMVIPSHPNWDPGYPSVGISASDYRGDPRINKKQAEALRDTTKYDSQALIMGMDENQLPVVRARVGQPKTSRRWAIKRNGDPTTAGALYEVWGAPATIPGS